MLLMLVSQFLFTVLEAGRNLTPVSYTHLDVYKRQGIYFVEKYQEVNRIVEEILKHVGGEVRDLKSEGSLIGQTRLISCLLYTSRCV